MNTNRRVLSLSLIAALVFVVFACNNSPKSENPSTSGLSPEEQSIANATKQAAAETLGLKLEGSVDSGHKDNFSGLRTVNITFTRRLDSRTFIAYDKRISSTKENGLYKEPDEALEKHT